MKIELKSEVTEFGITWFSIFKNGRYVSGTSTAIEKDANELFEKIVDGSKIAHPPVTIKEIEI